MINYEIISTGSKGNAVVLDNRILIDCGVTFKKLMPVYRDIDIVLLTHIHSDHFKHATIRMLAYERPMLRFACAEWLYDELKRCGVNSKNIDVFNIGEKYDYGYFEIIPVKLYHNVPNCGFKIRLLGQKVFYATDTKTFQGVIAKNYDLYMIEANYDTIKIQETIYEKRKAGKYPYELDVLKNHMSIHDSQKFYETMKGENSSVVYLHGHDYGVEK